MAVAGEIMATVVSKGEEQDDDDDDDDGNPFSLSHIKKQLPTESTRFFS